MPSTIQNDRIASIAPADPAEAEWPAEVDLVLSALEAAGPVHDDRREYPRLPYRVRAELRLFSDTPGSAPRQLFTRDVSIRGVGFVTRERLPLGYGGTIALVTPNGRPVNVNGTIFRCRDIGNDWYEGAMYFNRDQYMFQPID